MSTYDQPVQSFIWDDFTCQPDRRLPLRLPSPQGQAEEPRPLGDPLTLTIRTEPLYGERARRVLQPRRREQPGLHEQYGNTPIDDLDPDRQKQALGWLSRDLDDALLRFVDRPSRATGCWAASTSSPTSRPRPR